MASDASHMVAKNLRVMLAAQSFGGVSDRALLERFVRQRDEAAFATLVQRYTPMVLGTCRRVLRNAHDAEDICQATFLILVHKASGIRKRESLGGWLHRVAYRLSRDLATQRARRAAEPLPAAEIADRVDQAAEPSWREVRAVVDEELQHLPEQYRAPLILCYLNGKTRDEAAHQLGWSADVFRGRLERGREALRHRLRRRGIALSAALLAETLSHGSASASAPISILFQTIKYSRHLAAGEGAATGVPSSIADLVTGGLKAMAAAKKKVVLLLALLVCVAGVSGYAIYHNYAVSPEQSWAAALNPQEAVSGETVELAGQVLDPGGHPVAGAKIYVVSFRQSPLADGRPGGVTGADGKFAFSVAKGELARHLAVDDSIHLAAAAKDFGLSWGPVLDFVPEKERGRRGKREVTLRLVRDDAPISGRIDDAAGKPVAGARVQVEIIWANAKNDLTAWLQAVKQQGFEATEQMLPLQLRGPGLGSLRATTDLSGRFRLSGLGSGRLVALRVSGPGVATATIIARTERGPQVPVFNLTGFIWPQPYGCFGADLAITTSAGRPIMGVVRDLKTGKPVAGAVVHSHRFAGSALRATPVLSTRTDAKGHYRLEGMPVGKGNMLLVRNSADLPYLPAVQEIDTSAGEGPAVLDWKLRRGLWAEGLVTDAVSGRPLAADVEYYCLASNPNSGKAPGFEGAIFNAMYQTDAAGRYRVPVLPGQGVLAVELHGRRTYFLGASWVTQAGKQYSYRRDSIDVPPELVAKDYKMYLAEPAHVFDSNRHKMELINPAEGAGSITCDFPIGKNSAQKQEGKP